MWSTVPLGATGAQSCWGFWEKAWNIPQLPTQQMRKLATDSLQPWAESFFCGCCPLAFPVCLKGSQGAALVE